MNIFQLLRRIKREYLTVIGIIVFIIFIILVFFQGDSIDFKDREFIITTGSREGVYYPAGKALCSIIEKETEAEDCDRIESDGSQDNVDAIMDEDAQIGIVQSDIFYTNQRNLKQVGALHTENLMVIVRNDVDIESLSDLAGRKIIIGSEDSQTYKTSRAVLEEIGVDDAIIADVEEEDIEDISSQFAQLCSNNEVSAVFYVVGYPSTEIQEALNSCPNTITTLSLKNSTIRKMTEKYPFYKKSIIPEDTYETVEDPIQTIGLVAVIAVSDEVEDKEVEYLRKLFIDNIETIQEEHSALEYITEESMAEMIIGDAETDEEDE
ncbi:MAG: TAXI family TRAP transporter solute-binding subunit [Candidatus Spechtbacteria bacterium SB0662_bin_43]|uniref:TAXI family TRAP transporter solute-binding subunit n=1 Tax=Candidatus Spechtbacteria bacterium SB0662_bin_43 TaxID=2604897 RepID=A0A845DA82_9BACT|nr:TAXI family TRAP transporter solute-binding subunit [Candidatus Spechtbacteria bacterium SB0662_bin_43]